MSQKACGDAREGKAGWPRPWHGGCRAPRKVCRRLLAVRVVAVPPIGVGPVEDLRTALEEEGLGQRDAMRTFRLSLSLGDASPQKRSDGHRLQEAVSDLPAPAPGKLLPSELARLDPLQVLHPLIPVNNRRTSGSRACRTSSPDRCPLSQGIGSAPRARRRSAER